MSARLPQIVVEVTGGDVYITHNLGADVMVTEYDYDRAEKEGADVAARYEPEVTVGQEPVDVAHKEWTRYVRENDPDPHQQTDLYDCSKDYWNDRGPDEMWAD